MNKSALIQYNAQQELLPPITKNNTERGYQSLWLCIYLPKLAVHALGISEEETIPFVIFEENTKGRIIHYASATAQQAGIEAGMDVSKAYILSENVKTSPRSIEKEKALIKVLGEWAVQFSSFVSIKYESSILIEIRGSLKLFGGIHQLQKKITCQLQKKGYPSSIAVCPTPLASFLFSRASRNIVIENKNTLRAELGKLTLEDFLLDHKSLDKLHNIGIRKGYQLFRLPPASLGRRLGQGICRYLNDLLGITYESISSIRTQHSFHRFYEFQKDQEDLEIILTHINILLKGLIRFLIQSDLSTRALKVITYSSGQKQTTTKIYSNTQCRNEQIWKILIREKFYSASFNTSVYKISLFVDAFEPYQPVNESTLHAAQKNYPDWETTLDQVAARLGETNIFSLDTTEDYRPEQSHIQKAYTNQKSLKKASPPCPYRPTWLLPDPACISNSVMNTLKKSCNVERIEDGWWDKNPVQRDYFIAKNNNNDLLWIFTDLTRHSQYFIHGYFA